MFNGALKQVKLQIVILKDLQALAEVILDTCNEFPKKS